MTSERGAVTREFQSVALMALGFGLVGIDRFLIVTMFPVIARDLHLSYGDIGLITGALAVAWGISALFTGNASDRIGRRTVLVGSLLVFAVLIGASGLAAGLGGLVHRARGNGLRGRRLHANQYRGDDRGIFPTAPRPQYRHPADDVATVRIGACATCWWPDCCT